MSNALDLLRPAKWWPEVSWSTTRNDILAGLTGASVVLPQAVAFAAIAGLPPQYGMFAAIITPIVAALFGSSMVMVSGPTTAISAIVFSSISGITPPGSAEFFQIAILLAVLVGAIQLCFGLFGLGRLVAFVSHSVLLGFTAAAAMLIAISQLSPFFGIQSSGHSIFERLTSLYEGIGTANVYAICTAAIALITTVLVKRMSPLLPNYLIGLLAGGLFAFFVVPSNSPIAMVGALPNVLPSFGVPRVNTETIGPVIESAFAIAFVALLEAVSIGRSFAPKTGKRFDANQEIVGQGLSNIVGGFFGAYPGSGSFTRSGVNFSAGAKTPLSAIASSLFLVIILLAFAPLVAHIPVPALAGIIVLVAWNLMSPKEIISIARSDKVEAFIVAVTFLAGIVVGLEFAIVVGVIISLMVFLSKSARPHLAVIVPDGNGVFRNAQVYNLPQCPQIIFARLDGPLYFGSAEAVEVGFQSIGAMHPSQKHLVLILKGVGDVDLAGGQALIDEVDRRHKTGGEFRLVARYQPLLRRLGQLGVLDRIRPDHTFQNKGDAIEKTTAVLNDDICAGCEARIFKECINRPGPATAKHIVAEG
ncbi:hypothetical protein A9Q96_03235 [Rhodobacterales bacterium 52_120_T64]|nr:hypothetical protein A9Q96_03235 [Rhodobacterales bacterium 52_120_T64]